MRKTILLIPIVFILALMGCEKTELEGINQEITNLQDSISVIIEQHYHLLDSISVLISNVNDENFDIKACKMEQIGSLFNAIARQPEVSEFLIEATEILYSDISELLPLSDEAVVQRGKARGFAFSCMFNAIARQPEAFAELDIAATKFLGVYDPGYISDELLDISKIYTTTAMNEAIARQPNADSLFNLTCMKYFNFEIDASIGD